MKKAFKVKQKGFFMIFKRASVAKNCLRPESAPLRFYLKLNPRKKVSFENSCKDYLALFN